ncbi:MAG: T9SS type A sorting domain-containing protein, partial [Bacteroidales bacterium]|nr:T9SS type A sorting domain-containing protein [Bacteroidales bacterium]
WHHLVMVHSVDNAQLNFYLDNALYGGPEEATWAADMADLEEGSSLEDDNIKLGVAGIGWNDWEEGQTFPDIMYFDGFMDDIRLFNVALTVEQIDEVFNYTPTGVGDFIAIEQFKVFPNPASGIVQIQAESNVGDVNIYNMAGQKVLSTFNQTLIDISSLSRGMYFLEATVNGTSEVQKFIVE